MKLDERKFLILQAIIDDYITTAVPVGSRTISRKAGVGFSPATIRNEMSDLEELGYLDQPHTSAGRIPSYKAYRLYVDRLLKVGKLSDEDARRIQGHIDRRTGQIEEVIRNAAQVLSDMTQYTSLVMPPQSNTLRINRVQLVQVNDNTALMIVVTNAGIVKDTVIRIPEEMHADHLYSISKMLTEMLKDRPMHEVRAEFAAMFRDMQSHRRLFANVLDVLENELREDHVSDMVVGGSANLLNYPEYSDIEKARNFLTVLESKEKLYPLLQQAGGMEFTIRIGPENKVPELKDCSVITASYRVGNHTSGTLGIIGPTRMNYSRVISVLDYMGKAISDLLSGNGQ